VCSRTGPGFGRFAIAYAKVVVEGLSCGPGVSLPDVGPVLGMAMGRHNIDTERDEIAAA